MERGAQHQGVALASTYISVYTPIDAYKQTNSAVLYLFSYLTHNMFYSSL